MAWTKGQSGNPAGRPKGSGKLTTVLRDRLDVVQSDGRTLAEHVTDVLVSKALEGDTAALRMVYDRAEGPARLNGQDDSGSDEAYGVVFYLPDNDRDMSKIMPLRTKLYDSGNSPDAL